MRYLLVASAASILLTASGTATSRAAAPESSQPETRGTAEQLIELGDQLSDNDHYQEAIDAFTRALQEEPDNGAALAGRSIAYAATNKLDEAVRDADNAERIIGDSALVHRARGLIAERRSDNNRAIAEYTAALLKDPADKWSLYSRAWLFQQAQKDVAALADADTFVEAHPTAAEGYILRGRILLAQQKFTVALLDADRLVRLFPDQPKMLASAADIYNGARDRQRAVQAIDRAIAIQPDYYLYRYMRGIFRRWDDFDGRRSDFNAALELDPGNLDVLTELAQLDFKQHRWTDAIAGFSAELGKQPTDYGVLAYRSMAYLNSGQLSLAQSDHANALRLASGPNDLNNICWAYANEGFALDWALEACNRALKAKPGQSRYLANRGLAELRLGQLDRALEDDEHAIASNAKEARAIYGRAVILFRQGNAGAAHDERQHALDIDPRIEETFEQYGVTDFENASTP